MSFDREKFVALVHYICRKCSVPSKLGKTKLHKILWLSDVQNYLMKAKPLTGERFIKMQYGPYADHLDSAIDELKAAGLMHVEMPEEEYQPMLFYAKGEPDTSLFTDKELSLVDSQMSLVIDAHTAGSISDKSHNEIWQMAIMHEEIPYQAYLVRRFAKPTAEDFAWAKAEIANLQG